MLYRLGPSVTRSPAVDASVAQQSGQWLVTIQFDDADTRAGGCTEQQARDLAQQLKPS
ncbi:MULTISPECIES: hypothetical protein [Tsukamurella]|uniref:Uncharacterized protein n=1 Tax=Tsukamurella columbiensis TaxID=128509 RepID=A0ABX1LDC6_9ACTN|nr:MULTISPECIES: hypothetical protein [Tsukamurella]NMD55355.1 hypothetical protein [Tsukamurella columbiensis]